MSTSSSTANHHPPSSITPNPLASTTSPLLTPLEQEVLDEYTRLLDNMNRLADSVNNMSTMPVTSEMLDGLRLLERKTATVCTLLKASVYSIVLQQEVFGGGNGGEEG